MNNAYFNPSAIVIGCSRLLQLMVDVAVDFFVKNDSRRQIIIDSNYR